MNSFIFIEQEYTTRRRDSCNVKYLSFSVCFMSWITWLRKERMCYSHDVTRDCAALQVDTDGSTPTTNERPDSCLRHHAQPSSSPTTIATTATDIHSYAVRSPSSSAISMQVNGHRRWRILGAAILSPRLMVSGMHRRGQ